MGRPLKIGEKILFGLFGLLFLMGLAMFGALEYIGSHRNQPLYPSGNQYTFSEEGLHGQTLFRKDNCTSCHSAVRNGTNMGLDLDGLGSIHDYDYFYNFLRFPEKTYRGGTTVDHGMPPKEAAYVSQMPDQDLQAIARFLSELKAPAGSASAPEPPPGDSSFIDTMLKYFAPDSWKHRAPTTTPSN